MTEKLFQVSDCDNLSNKQVRDLYKKFVNPSLEQLFGAFGIGDQEVDHSEVKKKNAGANKVPSNGWPLNPLTQSNVSVEW